MNGPEVLGHLRDLLIAYALALPIGWDQEQEARSAGLRTFPLVAISSCGLMLVAVSLFGASGDAHARVLQGLITGIGFIGGGAIIKSEHRVHGTATAASIWMTGVVGAAVGFGLYDIAVILATLNFLTLRLRGAKQASADRASDAGGA
jgi:putative Mg2+ transporter-C (MgtC) family protein